MCLSRIVCGPFITAVCVIVGAADMVDKIIVLDAGRAMESGTHGELLKKDGPYSRMWKEQLRTVEAETSPVSPCQ